MKPVDQIDTDDCFTACLASLLELPLSEVPYFKRDNGAVFPAAREWAAERGLSIVTAGYPVIGAASGTDCILTGLSPRGPIFNHSVVGCIGPDGPGFVLAHDPHPSKLGIVGEPLFVHFLVRL